MSVVVVATIWPVPEHRDEVVAAFTDIIPAVHAGHAGCELYALHEGPDRLVMIEKWASPNDLDAHAHTPELAELNRRLAGKTVADADIRVLTAHPVGTPEQGTV